jgi:hypothetical protein
VAYIEIPDELHQRLLSLGCATSDFYTNALEEALRRRALTENEPRQRAKPGPKVEVVRAVLSAYIEADLLDWLRSQMRGPKDLGAVTNSILKQARANGLKAFSDDG